MRPRSKASAIQRFLVRVELPALEIEVYAKSEAEAEHNAWLMIGQAGVRAFGTLAAARTE